MSGHDFAQHARIAYRVRTICCFIRTHSSSSFGLRLGGGDIQKRCDNSSNNSSTVMNDLNVNMKFFVNVVSASNH